MPLHLLGKKSWNVYNQDNIARVRRDEADAAAREAAAEQRMQEEDAARRMRILRGEDTGDALPAAPDADPPIDDAGPDDRERLEDYTGRERKRRRRHGEDDTERDLRYAREDLDRAAGPSKKQLRGSDAPIVDGSGHIALVAPGPEKPRKNADLQAEEEKRKREDPATMRFANAAGFKASVGENPWYSSTVSTTNGTDPPARASKDVWGNDDPRRADRDRKRVEASDPLLAIQRGVQGVRRVERAKREWRAEREREVDDLITTERREARRERRREGDQSQERRRMQERKERERNAEDGHRRRSRSRDRERRSTRKDASLRRQRGGEREKHASRRGSHRHSASDSDSLEGFRLDADGDADKVSGRSMRRR